MLKFCHVFHLYSKTATVSSLPKIKNSKRLRQSPLLGFQSLPYFSFSTSAIVKADLKPKVFERPRPIIAVHNWLYTVLVNRYHKLDFKLEEFCASCPFVVKHMLESLFNDDTEHLQEVIDADCLYNILNQWKDLPQNAKHFLLKLDSCDFGYRYPTIRLRLPKAINPSKELTTFMNIQIQLYYFASSDIVSLSDREQISKKLPFLNDMKLPVIYNFEFEREITRGVNDSWKLLSCGNFPSAAIKFLK